MPSALKWSRKRSSFNSDRNGRPDLVWRLQALISFTVFQMRPGMYPDHCRTGAGDFESCRMTSEATAGGVES